MTHPTPDPSTAPCVAPVIGKRALLQVLPGLIKIAEVV